MNENVLFFICVHNIFVKLVVEDIIKKIPKNTSDLGFVVYIFKKYFRIGFYLWNFCVERIVFTHILYLFVTINNYW